ncbi:TetR/AcrR family transcriptional regulator [Streptomyces sp. NBC_00457]|uniref:TetR/AcrR family transcriptional regulator n=1 Tax=Streptomyces sp. NBC_00457 TaxID=2975748 RepID=UPI002E22E6FE
MPHSGNRDGHGGEGTAAPAREPGATTRRRLEPRERREAILHAARELFSDRPYAGVSVADVAHAAEVSSPLVVFYYGSKRALYLAVIETAADSIRHGLRALPGPPSPQRFAAGVRFYAEYARAHRAGVLSLLRGGHEAALPEAAAAFERLRDEVAAQILADLASVDDAGEGGGGDGSAPATTTPAPVTALAVRGCLGYVDAVVAHWLTLPEGVGEDGAAVEPDTIAALAVGAFTGGLSAVASPGEC